MIVFCVFDVHIVGSVIHKISNGLDGIFISW